MSGIHRFVPSFLVAACLAAARAEAAPPHGGVAIFMGDPLVDAEIRLYDERTGLEVPSDPRLHHRVRLLPFDFNGRTHLHELLPESPRLVHDVEGASRIVLPREQGSVYHYRRVDEATGKVFFGYFSIDAEGELHIRAELEGVSELGLLDPFLDKVAVSPAGDALLVATTPASGGNLLEVNLRTGAVIDRTPQLGPLQLSGRGLALRGDWGIGIADGAILRFTRAPGAAAKVVPMGGHTPPWLSREVVLSSNGDWAVTAGGSSADAAFVFVFGKNGPARQASDVPARVSPAGFLPEHGSGPYMAVSDDGAACAWRVERDYSNELFTARLDASSPLHVTEAPRFNDTLDEVGVVGFVTPDKLVFGLGTAGESPATVEGGLDAFDLFQVRDLGAGEPETMGLTRSTGEIVPPFDEYADMHPRENVYWLPDLDGFLLQDVEHEELLVSRLDAPGLEILERSVARLESVARVADAFVASVKRSAAEAGRWELLRIDEYLAHADVLHAAGTNVRLDALVTRAHEDPSVAWVMQVAGQDVAVQRMELPTGELGSFRPHPPYGPAIAFGPEGGVVVSSRSGHLVWPEWGPPVQLLAPPVAGQILPGL